MILKYSLYSSNFDVFCLLAALVLAKDYQYIDIRDESLTNLLQLSLFVSK